MTWWMVVLCVVGYLLVGIVCTALMIVCNVIGRFDSADKMLVMMAWPLAMIIWLIIIIGSALSNLPDIIADRIEALIKKWKGWL